MNTEKLAPAILVILIALTIGCGRQVDSDYSSAAGNGSSTEAGIGSQPKCYKAKVVHNFQGTDVPWYVVTITYENDDTQDFVWRKDVLDRDRHTAMKLPGEDVTLQLGEINNKEFAVMWNDQDIPLEQGAEQISLGAPPDDSDWMIVRQIPWTSTREGSRRRSANGETEDTSHRPRTQRRSEEAARHLSGTKSAPTFRARRLPLVTTVSSWKGENHASQTICPCVAVGMRNACPE